MTGSAGSSARAAEGWHGRPRRWWRVQRRRRDPAALQRPARRPGRVAHSARARRARALASSSICARGGPISARAAFLLWGLWLLVTAAGVQPHVGDHPQLLRRGAGAGDRCARGRWRHDLWAGRARFAWTGAVLGVAILGSAALAWLLLGRTPSFAPGLGIAVVRGRRDPASGARSPPAGGPGWCARASRSCSGWRFARRARCLRRRHCHDGVFRRRCGSRSSRDGSGCRSRWFRRRATDRRWERAPRRPGLVRHRLVRTTPTVWAAAAVQARPSTRRRSTTSSRTRAPPAGSSPSSSANAGRSHRT